MRIKTGMESEYDNYVKKNTQDGYSAGVVHFAERWAHLMEEVIPADASSAEVERVLLGNAQRLSHESDTEGITGFMYGCAVSSLAAFWLHGEELRRWHNLETQVGTEGEDANINGGVLNPALLNVKS